MLAFRDARDWEQFHTLKNLAAGLAIEAGELLYNAAIDEIGTRYDTFLGAA